MKLAIYIASPQLRKMDRWTELSARLSGCEQYCVSSASDITPGTDMLLSIGGDGTFLSAAQIAVAAGLPVMGVNIGRLGFLSENKPENIAEPLLNGQYKIEDRDMLAVKVNGQDRLPALNEVSISRKGSTLIGVDVTIDGTKLPTYWADGLLVATSAGSTGYSLSVGGPICMPASQVLIVSPIAPHNLNVRPLIVPLGSQIGLDFHSREPELNFTVDNRPEIIGKDAHIDISVAQFSLKLVRLEKSNFIDALRSKLFWGEDVRNED